MFKTSQFTHLALSKVFSECDSFGRMPAEYISILNATEHSVFSFGRYSLMKWIITIVLEVIIDSPNKL